MQGLAGGVALTCSCQRGLAVSSVHSPKTAAMFFFPQNFHADYWKQRFDIEETGGRAADSAANTARDSAAEARSEYYTAEEMAEFAKPKKKKVRWGRFQTLVFCPAGCAYALQPQGCFFVAGCCNRVCSSALMSCQ